jgi:hypothetical protein
MRYSILALMLLTTTAYAQDPPKRNYTVDEINSALDFFNEPHLGSSRILHDDNRGTREHSTMIITSGQTTDGSSTISSGKTSTIRSR